MEKIDTGKEANEIVSMLKEKTHDYRTTQNVLMAAIRILNGRVYTETGWTPETPVS